jgi:GMP synthase (glutamine-hydrolysing)
MLPCNQKLSELAWKPKGIILSGGPYSVYWDDAPHVDPTVFDLNVPILGICYGLQEIAWHFGKNVLAGEKREYGHAFLKVERNSGKDTHVDALFNGLEDNMEVWMSHGDKLSNLTPSFATIATTSNAPFVGMAHEDGPYYGIQFSGSHSYSSWDTIAQELCRGYLQGKTGLDYGQVRRSRDF